MAALPDRMVRVETDTKELLLEVAVELMVGVQPLGLMEEITVQILVELEELEGRHQLPEQTAGVEVGLLQRGALVEQEAQI
jgi:hypothetical protein